MKGDSGILLLLVLIVASSLVAASWLGFMAAIAIKVARWFL